MSTLAMSPTPQAIFPPVVPLLNSVIDVCLVYGIDETSARELHVTEKGVSVGGSKNACTIAG